MAPISRNATIPSAQPAAHPTQPTTIPQAQAGATIPQAHTAAAHSTQPTAAPQAQQAAVRPTQPAAAPQVQPAATPQAQKAAAPTKQKAPKGGGKIVAAVLAVVLVGGAAFAFGTGVIPLPGFLAPIGSGLSQEELASADEALAQAINVTKDYAEDAESLIKANETIKLYREGKASEEEALAAQQTLSGAADKQPGWLKALADSRATIEDLQKKARGQKAENLKSALDAISILEKQIGSEDATNTTMHWFSDALEAAGDIDEIGDRYSKAKTKAEQEKILKEYFTAVQNKLKAFDDYMDKLNKLDTPENLENLMGVYVDEVLVYKTAYAESIGAGDKSGILLSASSVPLLQWYNAREASLTTQINRVSAKQIAHSQELLEAQRSALQSAGSSDKKEKAQFTAEADKITDIYPNIYPSLDSVANIYISANQNGQKVKIEAEIPGFTEKWSQQLEVGTSLEYVMVKPALLSTLKQADLNTVKEAQLNLTVTDVASGDTLLSETSKINLHSLYDLAWYNDEFGSSAAFDLLAWMRPNSQVVSKIKEMAVAYLCAISENKFDALPGYQDAFGLGEANTTILQVAAIQRAISDLGVKYVMGPYTFGDGQRVLTPDQVVSQKSGICIESSILMASCLQSMGMHALVVLSPSHAQIAVESWKESGQYFLIETTTLPYEGISAKNLHQVTYSNGAYKTLTQADKNGKQVPLYGTYELGTVGSYGALLATSSDGKIVANSDSWKTYFVENYAPYYDQGYSVSDFISKGGFQVIDCDLRTILNRPGLESLS